MKADIARQLFARAGQPLPAALCPAAPRPSSEGPSPWERQEEAKIHHAIMNWLAQRGWLYIRARMDKRSPFPVGWPDFTVFIPSCPEPFDLGKGMVTFQAGCVLPARTVFLEVKTPVGKLTKEQADTLADLDAAGFATCVPRSDAEAIAWLRAQVGECLLAGALHPGKDHLAGR